MVIPLYMNAEVEKAYRSNLNQPKPNKTLESEKARALAKEHLAAQTRSMETTSRVLENRATAHTQKTSPEDPNKG